MRVRWLFIVLYVASLTACSSGISTKADVIRYINDPENGLKKITESNNILTVLTYRPSLLMTSNAYRKNVPNAQFDDKLYFVLSLSANNAEVLKQLEPGRYSTMVQVFAFNMSNYITISAGKGKGIAPESCFYQPTYGVSRANELLLIFDKKKLALTDDLYIDIREFGLGTGDMNFRFDSDDIERISAVQIN